MARRRTARLQLVQTRALLGRQDLAHLGFDLVVHAPHPGEALLQDRIELLAVALDHRVHARALLGGQSELMQR